MMMDILAQAASETNATTPNLSNALIIYGPLGIFFTGALLLARKYIPLILDAYIENVKSSQEQTVRVGTAVERLSTEFKTIADNTTTLASVNKQQADALTLLAGNSASPAGDHPFSTLGTNKAIRLLAEARLLETSNPEARKLIGEAMEAVRHPKQ